MSIDPLNRMQRRYMTRLLVRCPCLCSAGGSKGGWTEWMFLSSGELYVISMLNQGYK